MPEELFSPARLATYRALEREALCDPVEMQVVDRVVAGQLWLPISLIEIGFRNRADRAIATVHSRGDDWLFDPSISLGQTAFEAIRVIGAPALIAPQPGTTQPFDPVRESARMAARQLQRTHITRNDIVAHLMLGFWIARCPDGLGQQGIDMWAVLAPRLAGDLGQSKQLSKVMNKLGDMRNRIAHHEPLVLRRRHVYANNTPKTGAALLQSISSALDAFFVDMEKAIAVARVIAAPAAPHFEDLSAQVHATLAPLRNRVEERQRQMKELRAARLAARERAYLEGAGRIRPGGNP